jgi:biotin operon repressor/anti-sigma regulatory factor (Ser/Thr protein kinase)
MDTEAEILKTLRRRAASGADLAKQLKISRQAVHIHLKGLVLKGQVVKTGTTRGAMYVLSSDRRRGAATLRFSKTFTLAGLAEDEVFLEAARRMQLARALPANVRDIIRFGFTEMLNNAIEHSCAAKCKVEVCLDPYVCLFIVRDFGIGLFQNIATQFGLPNENAAVGELLKGKATTMAERHSGEGIFFTSRAGDTVCFRSHKFEVLFDGRSRDVVVKERRFLRGTEVRFEIGRRSRRRLEAVFEEFAPAGLDYRFEKTSVLVKLFQQEYVSRSEARRMLARLDKFRNVELDFRDVRSLGQGFADEVFRVFPRAHPGVTVKAVNVRTAVEPMIRHVLDNAKMQRIDNSLTIGAERSMGKGGTPSRSGHDKA